MSPIHRRFPLFLRPSALNDPFQLSLTKLLPGLFLPISDLFNCTEKPSDALDGGFPKGEKLSGRCIRNRHRVEIEGASLRNRDSDMFDLFVSTDFLLNWIFGIFIKLRII